MSKEIKYKISATEGISKSVGKAKMAIGQLGQKITWLKKKTHTDAESMKRAWAGIKSGVNIAKKAILGLGAIGAAGAAGIIATIKKSFAKETILVKFAVKLGSRAAAKAAYKKVSDFSDVTPFTKDEVLAGADQLMNVKGSDELKEWLQVLGDITAGAKAGTQLEEIAGIFVKIQNKGKASMEELQQLAERGIDIYGELAKSLGKPKDAIFEMSSKGQLSASIMEQAFRQMTGEGGKFNGMMDQLSQTGDGLVSTLKGKWSSAMEDFGDAFKESAKKSLKDLIDLLDRLRSDGTIEEWADRSAKALKVVSEIMKDIFGNDKEARMEALTYLGDGLKAAARDMMNIMLQYAPRVGEAIGRVAYDLISGASRRRAISQLEKEGKIDLLEGGLARAGLIDNLGGWRAKEVDEMVNKRASELRKRESESVDGESLFDWAKRGKETWDPDPWWKSGMSEGDYEPINITPIAPNEGDPETKKTNNILKQIARNTDPKNRSIEDMAKTILGRARETGGYAQTRLARQFHEKINPFGSEGPDNYFHARIKNEGILNNRTVEEKLERIVVEQVKTRKKVMGME